MSISYKKLFHLMIDKGVSNSELMEKLASKYGYRYIVVEKEKDAESNIISSTYIRDLLAEGMIGKANKLLGWNTAFGNDGAFIGYDARFGSCSAKIYAYIIHNILPPDNI